MQPSPIVIVFVSKKPTLSLLVWVLLCSVQRSVLFFFIMYVEQALDLRILVTRTYINTHTHTATMTPILAGSISLALAMPTTDTLKRTSFVFVVVHEVHHKVVDQLAGWLRVATLRGRGQLGNLFLDLVISCYWSFIVLS